MKPWRLLAGAGSGLGVAVAFAAGGVPATSGCTTHQCDGDMVCIDSTGSMKTIAQASDCTPVITGGTPIPFYNLNVDDIVSTTGEHELTWATSSLLGTWLDFPGQRTYVIQFPPGFAGNLPTLLSGLESSDNDAAPDASHANFTNTSGQLLEYTNISDSQVSIFNDTCVDYGLRLVFEAFVPATGGPDATAPTPEASPSPPEEAAPLSSDDGPDE